MNWCLSVGRYLSYTFNLFIYLCVLQNFLFFSSNNRLLIFLAERALLPCQWVKAVTRERDLAFSVSWRIESESILSPRKHRASSKKTNSMALLWEKLSPQEFQQLQDLATCELKTIWIFCVSNSRKSGRILFYLKVMAEYYTLHDR